MPKEEKKRTAAGAGAKVVGGLKSKV